MPPRRSTRAATSTPTRASTRALTPGRTTALESTPLPDVEAEQSFAYGSSNAKLLPLQLVARRKMTIEQMAETLDAGIIEAERNFQVQREQADQYGMTSSDARAARAARRSSERESRASSVESDQTPVPKASRRRKGQSADQTQHWLQDIQEERNPQEEADAQEEDESLPDPSNETELHHTHSRVTLTPPPPPSRFEQSSMPDVNRFDQTYTLERDLHAQGTIHPPTHVWGQLLRYLTEVRDFFLVLWDRTWWYIHEYTFSDLVKLGCKVLLTASILLGFFLYTLMMARRVCEWYCETPWSTNPTRAWHHRVNEICRYSTADGYAGGITAEANVPASPASAFQIATLQRMVKHQEKIVHDMQARQSVTSATIDELTERQSELLKHQSELQSSLADAKAAQATSSKRSPNDSPKALTLSPIFKRINYASRGLGAIIDPYLTSPTKTKHFPFYQRLLLGSAGIKKYQSRPPVEALKPWTEVGDCWCAAAAKRPNEEHMDGTDGRFVQLGILLGHDIFPDEVVIEHLPLKTTPSPGSAPKDIEVWGDFSHLNKAQFAALQMGPHALQHIEWYPQLGLLGRIRYDAVANEEGQFLQIFRLDFNQNHMDEYWMKKVVFRINSNWGAENTCLYRVRVHGVPVHPHPEIMREKEDEEKTW